MRTAVILSVLAIAIGTSKAGGQQQDPAERGMKVYKDKRCQVCHSVAGKGNEKGPLDEVGSKYSSEEILKWLLDPAEMMKTSKSERMQKMKSYATLPKEDQEALVAYLLTLKKK